MDFKSKTKLQDLIHIKHGFAFKGEFFKEYHTENILLTPGNFKIGGGFNDKKFRFYDGPINNDYVLQENDLIITMTDLSKAGDTLGYPAFVPNDNTHIYLHNQRLGKITIKEPKKILKKFLYYVFCRTDYRNEVLGSATGTTVKHTSPERILSFEFNLPTLSEQEKIEKTLYDLDTKIENLQTQNKVLKQMAHAIFKAWFVDFDGQTEFEDSELGQIPKGWFVSVLSKHILIQKGKKPKILIDHSKEGYLPQILIETLNDGEFSYAHPKGMVISETTDTIMVMDGKSSGRVDVGYHGVVGSTLAKITSKNTPYFFYFLIKNLENILKSNQTGTAITHTDKHLLLNTKIIIPPSEILEKFNKISFELQTKITKNKKSIPLLNHIRDSLLPKLMSGEIRV